MVNLYIAVCARSDESVFTIATTHIIESGWSN